MHLDIHIILILPRLTGVVSCLFHLRRVSTARRSRRRFCYTALILFLLYCVFAFTRYFFLESDLSKGISSYTNKINSPCFYAIQDQCSISAISLIYWGISNPCGQCDVQLPQLIQAPGCWFSGNALSLVSLHDASELSPNAATSSRYSL